MAKIEYKGRTKPISKAVLKTERLLRYDVLAKPWVQKKLPHGIGKSSMTMKRQEVRKGEAILILSCCKQCAVQCQLRPLYKKLAKSTKIEEKKHSQSTFHHHKKEELERHNQQDVEDKRREKTCLRSDENELMMGRRQEDRRKRKETRVACQLISDLSHV